MTLIKGKKIDFYYLDKPEYIPKLIKKFQPHNLIAADSETYPDTDLYQKASALDPHTSKIRLLQVNYPGNPTPFIVDCLKIGIPNVIPFFMQILMHPDKRVLAFNFPFDLKIFRKNFGDWVNNAWCVQLMMQLIGGATGYKWHQTMGYSYKAMCRDYLGARLDKTEGASDWADPNLSLSQLEYAALDVGALRESEYTSYLIAGYELFYQLLTTPMPYLTFHVIFFDLRRSQNPNSLSLILSLPILINLYLMRMRDL